MPPLEQRIYNSHLRSSRPPGQFRPRKNFDDLSEEKKVWLAKLSIFFEKFTHIDIDEFFNAPHLVYPDNSQYGLEFYITPKAVKIYSLLKQKQQNDNPDNEEQLTSMVNSLKFIRNFCKENNITIENYLSHKSSNISSFVVHLKEHRVNLYTLLGFEDFDKKFKENEIEHLKFMLGSAIYENIDRCRTNLLAAKKAFKLVQLGIEKLKQQNKQK